jgi:hypothetical protein
MAGITLKNNEISYNSSAGEETLTVNNSGNLSIKPSTTGSVIFSNRTIPAGSTAAITSAASLGTNLVIPGRLVFGVNKRMYYDTSTQRAYGLHAESSIQNVTTGLSSTTTTGVFAWLSPVVTYTPRFTDSIVMFEALICSECYNRGSDNDFTAGVSVEEVDVNTTTVLRSGSRYGANSTSSNSRNIGYGNAFQSGNAVNHGVYDFIKTRAVPAVRSSDGLVRVRGGGRIYTDGSAGYGVFLDFTGLIVNFTEYV